jgi:hypothetical protein
MSNYVTQPTIWEFDGTGYVEATVLAPGRAYWLYSYQSSDDEPAELLVPNPAVANPVLPGVPRVGQATSIRRSSTGVPDIAPPPPAPPTEGLEVSDLGGGGGGSGGGGCFAETAGR